MTSTVVIRVPCRILYFFFGSSFSEKSLIHVKRKPETIILEKINRHDSILSPKIVTFGITISTSLPVTKL